MIDWSAAITPDSRLEQSKSDAKRAFVNWIDRATREITGYVPEDEKISWSKKEAAARETIETGVPHRAVVREAARTGEDPMHLAHIIVKKADAYADAIFDLTGIRRNFEKSVDAATSETDISLALQIAKDAWTSGAS